MTNQIKWLLKRQTFLVIDKIEKDLDMPSGTIKHWLADRRSLPEKWRLPLEEWLRNFKK